VGAILGKQLREEQRRLRDMVLARRTMVTAREERTIVTHRGLCAMVLAKEESTIYPFLFRPPISFRDQKRQ